MTGIKHLIECHCIMPQYRNIKNPPYHKFVVFSQIDSSDTVVPKHAACNNCGVIHNVIDISRSEILSGREQGAIIEKEDMKFMLPQSIQDIFENYGCEIPDWEHALFILENKKWGEHIILNRKEEMDDISGKILKFYDSGKYRIEPYMIKRTI